jgi:transcriptional regulator with XRE-family HTH domain
VLLTAPYAGANVRTMKSEIGVKIRNRREELKMSQLAVAEKVGMSRAHLTRIEGGSISPKFNTVVRIAKALKTTPLALLAA